MVHRESIGKVVGNDGDTYKPNRIIGQNDNTLQIEFINSNDELDVITPNSNAKMPYYTPVVVTDNNGDKKITFELNSNAPPSEIPFSEIKGDTGATGSIKIEFIDLSDTIDVNELNTDTLYLDTQTDDDSDKKELSTYVVIEKDGQKKLKAINSIVDLSNYCTQGDLTQLRGEIDSLFSTIRNEQQSIYNTLTNGIQITESDYTLGDNVINVMSDASVEDLRQQIYEELQDYVRESDIVFDSETGTINIKY